MIARLIRFLDYADSMIRVSVMLPEPSATFHASVTSMGYSLFCIEVCIEAGIIIDILAQDAEFENTLSSRTTPILNLKAEVVTIT